MAGCLVVTLPLEFVLGARVWRRPRRLLAAVVPTVVVFSAWDLLGIHTGLWSYDARYVTGVRLPGQMPLEELVFFVVVPICALLSFEAVGILLGRWRAPGPSAARASGAREAT